MTANIPDSVSVSPRGKSRRGRWSFIVGLVALSGIFAQPILGLARLVASKDLYTHIPLIPLVTLYFIWLKRRSIAAGHDRPSLVPVCVPAALGTVALISYWLASPAWRADPANSLFLLILAYVCFIWTLIVGVFGWSTVRQILFPLAFLVFLVPYPTALTHGIEISLQYASAEAASFMFTLSQLPVLRDGLFFKLPGITLEVAQECSGVRSTFVLFVSSVVAGYMFFRLKRYRAILALAVVPIAIARNGFRIVTIGYLCVKFGPDMIDSFVHRKGGPIFFALSLIPFFVLVLFLYRREQKSRTAESQSLNTRTTLSVR